MQNFTFQIYVRKKRRKIVMHKSYKWVRLLALKIQNANLDLVSNTDVLIGNRNEPFFTSLLGVTLISK